MSSSLNQKNISLTRLSGAGNTFFIYDAIDSKKLQNWNHLSADRKRALVSDICHKKGLAKTDGFIVLGIDNNQGNQKIDENNSFLSWDFYNSDGSSAEMCGNAARCVAKYVFDRLNFSGKQVSLNTVSGLVNLKKQGNIFSVEMPTITEAREAICSLKRTIAGFHINSGVPHFVTTERLSKEECSDIRKSFSIFPNGTNVTLISYFREKSVHAVTFERGVEDFTPACGTGAVAAAYWHSLVHQAGPKIEVQMPGGELIVELGINNAANLIGPAEEQFDISISI